MAERIAGLMRIIKVLRVWWSTRKLAKNYMLPAMSKLARDIEESIKDRR